MEFATFRPPAPTPSGRQIWRPHPLIRLTGWVGVVTGALVVFAAAILAFAAATRPDTVLFWAVAGVGALLAYGFYFMALRPFVALEDGGVRVRNLFSEHLLAWHDISGVRPGYWGLTLTLRSRRPVCAFALQKSNYAAARGMHETISDVAARTIMQRATGDPTHPGLALPSESDRAKSARTARIVMGIAAAYLVLRIVIEAV